MDEGNRKLDIQDEQMDDADLEKMQRDTTNLLRQSENCMFTIQVAPGTVMHINIAPETGPIPATWCISTLIIHNGQHYTNTIHNFTVNPELIHNLGLVQDPAGGNILQQLMMSPLDLPRNPVQSAPRILVGGGFVQPTAVYRMVEHYCSYVMRTARILDNVFGWVAPQQNPVLPALVQDIHFTSQSLQAMLERVQRSVQAAEQLFMPSVAQLPAKIEDESKQTDINELHTDEEISSETEDETEDEGETCECTPEYVPYDDYDDSQIKCDNDSSSSDSDIRSSIFLGPDFEEFPQQFWSLTSSEEENEEEQGDEESWESDFEDDESFDAYMVRQLRAHATGLATRLNSDWVNLANEPTQADDDDWDIGSCGTNGDIEDIRSEISCSSEDLNAWQYNEDRTFETELSRPFRRLVGELPAQTAQEERYAWRHTYENFNYRRGLRHSPNYRQYPDESVPLSFYSHWRPQENLATSSASSQSESPGRNGAPYTFSFYSNNLDSMDNVNDSMQPNLSQMQDIDLDDLDQERETTPEPNSDSEPDELEMDVDIEPDEVPIDQQIVPLETFIQQTDELIAQIWASL